MPRRLNATLLILLALTILGWAPETLAAVGDRPRGDRAGRELADRLASGESQNKLRGLKAAARTDRPQAPTARPRPTPAAPEPWRAAAANDRTNWLAPDLRGQAAPDLRGQAPPDRRG
ncbi:MAG: hypothetical protein LBE01_03370, partial [Deltaproteobacteria bacterium]|nr:hypothetical protein [Deltaproteobacteria bacterium]